MGQILTAIAPKIDSEFFLGLKSLLKVAEMLKERKERKRKREKDFEM